MKFRLCPACKGLMVLIMKASTGGWMTYWTCLEKRSTGCEMDYLDDI